MVASRSFLQWLLVHLKFTLDGEVLFCWYKWGLISMSYNSSTSSWKPWRWLRFYLILTMRDDKGYMHQFQPRVTCKVLKQQQRTESKYILLWNFLQLIMKTIPISTIIIESCEMKKMIPHWVQRNVNGNWGNNPIRISLRRESHCRTNTRIKRNKEVQIKKEQDCENHTEGLK